MGPEMSVGMMTEHHDAEIALAGSVLLDPAEATRTLQHVTPDDMIHPGAAAVYRAVVDLYEEGSPVDAVILADHLRRGEVLDRIGGISCLALIIDAVPSAANAVYYARICARQKRARDARIQFMLALHALDHSKDLDADQVIAEASAALTRITRPPDDLAQYTATAHSLVHSPPDRPVSLLGPRLITPGGFAMLTGYANVGKSFALQQMALALASGTPWLGTYAATRCDSVIYLSMENPPWNVGERMQALAARIAGELRDAAGDDSTPDPDSPPLMDAALTRIHCVSMPPHGLVSLSSPTAEANLIQMIERIGAKVIMIDPLNRVHDARDENDAREMGRVFASVDRIRTRTGCAIVLAHHERKQPQGSTDDTTGERLYAGRGSSRIADDPDCSIRIATSRGDRRVLQITKSRYGHIPDDIYLRLDENGGGFSPTDPPKNQTDQKNENWIALYDLVAAAPVGGISRAELFVDTKCPYKSQSKVSSALRSMAAGGLIGASGSTTSRKYHARAGNEAAIERFFGEGKTNETAQT